MRVKKNQIMSKLRVDLSGEDTNPRNLPEFFETGSSVKEGGVHAGPNPACAAIAGPDDDSEEHEPEPEEWDAPEPDGDEPEPEEWDAPGDEYVDDDDSE